MLYIKMFNSFKANEALITVEDSDETEFLATVKAKKPELYNRFYSMVKNRGLKVAKTEYQKLKKETRTQIKTSNANKKVNNVIDIQPTKEELSSLINRFFLTHQFRQMCSKLNFPQLSSDGFEPQVVTNKKDRGYESILKIDLPGYKIFKNLTEYIKGANKQDIKKETDFQYNRYLNALRYMPSDSLHRVASFQNDFNRKRYFDEEPKLIKNNVPIQETEEFAVSNFLGIRVDYYVDDYNTSYGKELKIKCHFNSRVENANNSRLIKMEKVEAKLENEGSTNINKKVIIDIIGECLEELRDKILSSHRSINMITDEIDELES